MADELKRSQLIKQRIENLIKNAPQPYTKAEQDQIMKGRKKQADIDAGRAAIEARNKEVRDTNTQIGTLTDQLGGAEAQEQAAGRTQAADTRAEDRRNQASSPQGVATELGASLVAPVAGYAGGQVVGKLGNTISDLSQARKNQSLQGVADARQSGLVTARAAREAAERSGSMPSKNPGMRVGGRMLPHIIGGALSAGKGAMILNSVEEDDPFYSEMSKRGVGLGLIGAGGGMLQTGAEYALSPKEVPDARAMAVIESDQLRRGKAAQAAAPSVTPKGMLVEQAKAAGLKSVGKMNMGQLRSALTKIGEVPKAGILAPLAAGALAYEATRSPAEAADGGESNTGEALTNAAGAAGATALASRYAAPVLGAVGRAAGPMTPFAAADLSDNMTPDEVNTGQNWLARNIPATRHLPGSSIGKAYDMAQVPEAGPERRSMGPRRPDFNQALADFTALMQGQQ